MRCQCAKMEQCFLSGALMGQLVAEVGGQFPDHAGLNPSASHVSSPRLSASPAGKENVLVVISY